MEGLGYGRASAKWQQLPTGNDLPAKSGLRKIAG
jgi:hypothetical protein